MRTHPNVPAGHTPHDCPVWAPLHDAHIDKDTDDGRANHADYLEVLRNGTNEQRRCLLHLTRGKALREAAHDQRIPPTALVDQYDAYVQGKMDTVYRVRNAATLATSYEDRTGKTLDRGRVDLLFLGAGQHSPDDSGIHDLIARFGTSDRVSDNATEALVRQSKLLATHVIAAAPDDPDALPAPFRSVVDDTATGKREASRTQRQAALTYLADPGLYSDAASDPDERLARWAVAELAEVDPDQADGAEVVLGLTHGNDPDDVVTLTTHHTTEDDRTVKTTADGDWTVISVVTGHGWMVLPFAPDSPALRLYLSASNTVVYSKHKAAPSVDRQLEDDGVGTLCQTLRDAKTHIGRTKGLL